MAMAMAMAMTYNDPNEIPFPSASVLGGRGGMLLDATAPVHHDDDDIDAWGATGGGIVARGGGVVSGEGGGGASVSPPCNTHVGPSSPHHTTINNDNDVRREL